MGAAGRAGHGRRTGLWSPRHLRIQQTLALFPGDLAATCCNNMANLCQSRIPCIFLLYISVYIWAAVKILCLRLAFSGYGIAIWDSGSQSPKKRHHFWRDGCEIDLLPHIPAMDSLCSLLPTVSFCEKGEIAVLPNMCVHLDCIHPFTIMYYTCCWFYPTNTIYPAVNQHSYGQSPVLI